MNTWIGMGRLTRDPQIRVYGENNDKKMARFVIACDRRGKREEGQQTADFIPCVCYGKTADFVDGYLRQGTKIVVTGSVMTGSFEKDGQRVYTTDILASQIEFAESKRADASGGGQTASVAAPEGEKRQDTSFLDIPDGITEDLPFN